MTWNDLKWLKITWDDMNWYTELKCLKKGCYGQKSKKGTDQPTNLKWIRMTWNDLEWLRMT